VSSVWSEDRLSLAVTLRLVLGALLVYAAPECRAPQAVRAFGVVTLLAAVGLVFVGSARTNAFVDWWTQRPPALLRAWSVAGVLLGVFLVYAGT
jgi:hypothetical protein